jgi:hypothetical protein
MSFPPSTRKVIISTEKRKRSAISDLVLNFGFTRNIGWTNDLGWGVIDGPKNNFTMLRSGINFAF